MRFDRDRSSPLATIVASARKSARHCAASDVHFHSSRCINIAHPCREFANHLPGTFPAIRLFLLAQADFR
jgi:hypothetical protein